MTPARKTRRRSIPKKAGSSTGGCAVLLPAYQREPAATRARPGYDAIAQAYGGMINLTGDLAGPPQRAKTYTGDYVTAEGVAVEACVRSKTERKKLAAAIQDRAFEIVPYIPTGQWKPVTAYHKNLKGVIEAPAFLMWNVEKV
jgi:hypothetical protein